MRNSSTTLLAAAFGALVVAAACDTPFEVRELNGVSVAAHDQQVVVTNKSASPVFAFVIGREIEARTDWIPCVDAVRCPPIEPGSSRAYPYDTIMRETWEREVVVRWWHAAPDGSGVVKPTDFGSLVVPLFSFP
jgi:hypothetical protein